MANDLKSKTVRLLVCMLCSADEVFACTARHRRTYMRMHLQKAHGIDAAEIGLVRTARSENEVAWTTGKGNRAETVLTECDARIAVAERSTDNRPQPDEVVTSGNWTSGALQSLYSGRAGVGSFT